MEVAVNINTEIEKGKTFSETGLSTGYNPAVAVENHKAVAEQKKEQYKLEKRLGYRNPNGSMPLKKLSARHQKIIALHLSGQYSNNAIAEAIGCSAATITRVLHDPLATKIISEYMSAVEMDLKALLPLAVEAIRDGLNDKDLDVRLRAVDRLEKMAKRQDDKEQKNTTNIGSITFIQNTRERFFDELREAAEEASIIEGEATDITEIESADA